VDLAAPRLTAPPEDAEDDEGGARGARRGPPPTVGMRPGGIRSVGGVPLRATSILTRIDPEAFQTSSKIEALREELDRLKAADPGGKAIVFSQFTSFLELIAFRLEAVGYRVVRLEGGMALADRAKAVQAFTSDPGVSVFLLSLKAGGTALNLTCASAVFLMDPWWNPAVESQAADRAHRLGAYKPCAITRFVIAGSVEARIVKLQEKKKAVCDATVGGDDAALARLTTDDLRFLFS
jgi:DNA repair protein RAD16